MVKFSKKFYVTTAIDYVNSEPHIGHAYQKIAADVLARYRRLKGDNVFFLTGTDEHGQKIAKSAKKAGKTPKQFVDKTSVKFKQAWKALNLQYDRFIRTTDSDHEKSVQEFIKKMNEKGDIYRGTYEGLYCEGCEAFVTERELVDGKCPFHPNKQVQRLKEETYYFRLSKYQKKLLELYRKNPSYISPKNRREEIINRVKEGLRDLSITRTTFTWGIPFPLEKGHITYVWYEALLNYITGIGWPNKKYEEFWPADVQLLGKDNAWFHCVIWPAMLISVGIKPAKKIYVHGFLTFNGQKISKSLGNSISPQTLVDKYSTDAVRYFILRSNPFSEDGDFSERELKNTINSHLADDLGNLLNRTLVMINRYSNGKIPKQGKLSTRDKKLTDSVSKLQQKVDEHMNEFQLDRALDAIWDIIHKANAYINETEPWVLAKKNKTDELNTVLYNLAETLRIVDLLISPFIPETSDRIAKQLNVKVGTFKDLKSKLKPGHKIGKAEILFKKIEN